MLVLNIVWPAAYIYSEFWRFWFLVFVTIAVETLAIRLMLQYPLRKSLLASVAGNVVSGAIGTFIMAWALLFWHAALDNHLSGATFDPLNWVVSYALMCLGSVFMEVLVIKLAFKDSIKRLFIPLLLGNLLTYIVIAYSMATKTGESPF